MAKEKPATQTPEPVQTPAPDPLHNPLPPAGEEANEKNVKPLFESFARRKPADQPAADTTQETAP